MIVFCVVFCRSVIVLFLLAIVLPALALGDLKTLLALFLKQKRVRKFTWLDPIQCEKRRVQFSIGFNLVWKLVCNFMSLDNKWSQKKKPTYMQFYIAIAGIGPYRLWLLPQGLAVIFSHRQVYVKREGRTLFLLPKVKVEFRHLFSLQKRFSLCSYHNINANIIVFCRLTGLQWNNTRF